MKKLFNIALVALPLLAVAPFADADSQQVELGWADIDPCSRVVWNNDGIFNTPSPTVETAEQRVYAYATVDAADASSISNDIQQCAVQGVAAAGITSIVASPAGAMPAFSAQFEGCMANRSENYLNLTLSISDGQCMW